jgi:predicted phage terminase large subunit-like protein
MNDLDLRERLLALYELEYALAEKSLAAYCKAAWDVIEPATNLKWNWHHDLICEYLTAVSMGQIKRLLINVPPRSMKSIIVSVCYPTWRWIRDPHRRFICASYSQSLSSKLSRNRRSLIESPWYQAAWADRYALSHDQNVKSEFANDRHGYMIATSILGTATGKGCNDLIVDDPHDTTGAASDKKRETTIETFDQKFTTRLDDKEKDNIIVIMQRLHEKDLTGHILAKGGYTQVCIPQIAETQTTIVFPITKKEKIREENSLLHPAREGEIEIAEAKKTLGSFGFACQQQQSPAPKDGGLFKRKWWKFYRELPTNILFTIQVWDCAQTEDVSSDWSVCATWAATESGYYLLNIFREKMEYPQLKKAVALQYDARKPNGIWIENKSAGIALIQDLKQETKLPIIAFNPGKLSKINRAEAVTPTVEAGNCYLPTNAAFVEAFVDEHSKFPNASHDDQVDTTSMALSIFKERKPEPRIRRL